MKYSYLQLCVTFNMFMSYVFFIQLDRSSTWFPIMHTFNILENEISRDKRIYYTTYWTVLFSILTTLFILMKNIKQSCRGWLRITVINYRGLINYVAKIKRQAVYPWNRVCICCRAELTLWLVFLINQSFYSWNSLILLTYS